MADLTAQMVLTADASGVEAGVGRAKRSLADLGATAATEGKKASDSLGKMGDGSDKAAAKVEAATKSLIGSIQRTTAAQEAGSKSSSKYFETLASQRNINPDALRPYLSALDEVNKKRAEAAAASTATASTEEAANAKRIASFSALRDSVAQLNYKKQIADQAAAAASAAALAAAEEQAAAKRAAAFDRLKATVEQANYKAKIASEREQAAAAKALADAEVESANRRVIAFEKLKNSVAQANFKQQQAVKQEQQAFIGGLQTQVATKDLDSAGLLRYRAAQLGVSKEAEVFIAQLGKSKDGMGKMGISAAQTANALRGVPAQFTDIVTSLQGGQAPLTVLLQQGGQLKDMFGGIGPAARAMGGYIAGLINPLTLTAGAVALLGVAFYTATERAQAFGKALITSGNYVGKSAADLNDLSKSISNTIGTQGQAADALTALAGSGKIAGESLRAAGEAVVAQNKAMGTSIEDAVAQFVKLGEEPTKASAKLNESLHYLNQTTYDRIRALEEQGDKEGAAALAQDTYAKATVDRMQQVINQSGLLSKALSGTKDVALGMWNAVAQGIASIGAAQSAADKLVDAQRKVAYLKQNGSTPDALAAAQGDVTSLSRAALRDQDNAFAQGQKARDDAAKISASDRLKTLSDEVRTNADKRQKAIAALNRDYQTLGKVASGPEYDKLVANINEKFKDPKEAKGPREKAFQDDAATKMLESLRQQEAALKEQLTTDEKLTSSEKERAKFVQLVADLKTKGTLTIEQKSLLLAQDSIKAQLDKNVAIEAEVKAREDARKEAERIDQLDKQFSERARQRTEAISASRDSQNEQYDRIRATFGLGDRARAEDEAQRSIFREYNKMQLDLVKNTPEHLLGSDKFLEESQKIKDGLGAALDAQKQFYADEQAARENWLNGATNALANYADEAKNTAKMTQDAFTHAFQGLEDALVDFVTTGKLDFKKLVDSILADIARIAIKQSVTGPLASALGGALGGSGGGASGGNALGGIGGLLSSLFGGGGSGDVLGDFISM
jgi:lambda family phage tail tape measure protein